MSTQASMKLSRDLREIANVLEQILQNSAGEPVKFSLFCWTDGRAQYIANVQRPETIKALEQMIEGWKAGMPDVPAHEVQG